MNLKKFLYFSLIFVAYCKKIMTPVIENEQNLVISKVFREVIEIFYVKNQIQFDIVLSLELRTNFDDILSKILIQNREKFSYNFRILMNVELHLDKSAVFFVESVIDYYLLHNRYNIINMQPRPLKFFVYIDSCSLRYFRDNLNHYISTQKLTFTSGQLSIFEFLLINDGNFVYLATIEWFTETACNRPQLIVLNSFNKVTHNWNKKLENYDKFKDFHYCELAMGLKYPGKICWGSFVNSSKTEEIMHTTGLKPNLFRVLSSKLNFNPLIKPMGIEGDSPDIYFDVIRLSSFLNGFFHMTSSFLEVQDIVLITPGDLYSPYEKLWLPFDDTTWTFLLLTFLIAYIAIFIINRLPKFIQDQVYGENIQTPALNVISTFFGINLPKLPVKDMPRFIFINFVFFCLIFQTCYQSKLFEFMTTEPRRESLKTIEELKEENYTVYHTLPAQYVEELIASEKNNW